MAVNYGLNYATAWGGTTVWAVSKVIPPGAERRGESLISKER